MQQNEVSIGMKVRMLSTTKWWNKGDEGIIKKVAKGIYSDCCRIVLKTGDDLWIQCTEFEPVPPKEPVPVKRPLKNTEIHFVRCRSGAVLVKSINNAIPLAKIRYKFGATVADRYIASGIYYVKTPNGDIEYKGIGVNSATIPSNVTTKLTHRQFNNLKALMVMASRNLANIIYDVAAENAGKLETFVVRQGDRDE